MADKPEDAIVHNVRSDPAPAHDAASTASAPDLPPPPAQLLAALDEFETAAPESFSAVTTATGARSAVEPAADTTPIAMGALVVPSAASPTVRAFAAAHRGAAGSAVLALVLIVLGAIWMLSSSRLGPSPANSPAQSSAVVVVSERPGASGERQRLANCKRQHGSVESCCRDVTRSARRSLRRARADSCTACGNRHAAPVAPATPCGKSFKPCK